MKNPILFLLSAVIACCSLFPVRAAAQTGKLIRVGWYYADDAGNGSTAHSYDGEYLQALSQYTGWEYEFVSGTWEECLKRLENGEIDLLGFVHRTAEREQIYGYPSLPMATTSGYLVAGSGSELSEASLSSGKKITVGTVRGNGYNEDFKRYCEDNGINAEYVEYGNLSDISPALENGEIEAAVVAEEDKTSTEHIVTKFASYNQYFVTDIDNPELLRELDDAMIQVSAYCPYLNSDLYQKYLSVNSDGKPVFTLAEQEFIKNNKNILVLYDSGWPPIEYLDAETGVYKGISPDLFALLTEKCGINFVYEGSTSGEVLSELQNGDQRNVLTTISYDYEWAQKHDVYITQPFITSGIVKLGHNLASESPTVAINEKAFFAYLLADELEGKTALNFSKQAERLEAVRSGAADYTYVTEDQANYYRSIPMYGDFEIERLVGYQQQICISVEKNSDPELMSIISKSLACITHDEMTEIITRNTVNAYKLTFTDQLYKNRYQIIVIVAVAAVVIAALVWVSAIRRRSMRKITAAYKQKEEALQLAQKASVAKGSFMSRMSHEIRTPLNAVIGYNTIARSELSEAHGETARRQAEMKAMDCLTKSDIASKHLLTIINDVLDMSAIESGKIKVAHERFDFKGLITSLTTVFYSQAKAKGVNFEVVFDNATEEWFVGDQMRTNQILTNLISNAVKFTGEGGSVKLDIRQISDDGKAAEIRFEITDTGIGMAADYLSHIWTPFEQADSSISRRFGGTGLGLSITKSLIDIMGGEITVESKPGEGTTFAVVLSFEKTNQPEISDAYDFSGINALIVDDDLSTCDYISLLFNRCRARCATVTSGIDAIESFAQAEKRKDPFTVCLVDWRMPKMDGIETIKRIRKIAGDELPIIVITAYDFTELADKAAEVGVNMFVSKPLFQSSLFDLLANICGKTAKKEIKRNEKYDFTGSRVLLAEDNAMNMEIARKILESAKITVESAWNGKEAVSAFESAPAGTYGAILMDVQMPVMDGYQATRAIRASSRPDGSQIPIIAMTADAFVENIAESLAAGMNGHISKPIDITTLFETLEKYIH